MMNEPQLFQLLKNEVLLNYQKHYPYFQGNWKQFSSQDIQNLIDLIDEEQKQRISEKWIYTHLKPETNEKLPRKDMLDILCQFCGFSGWDEFVFINRKEDLPLQNNKKKQNYFWIIGIGLMLILFIFYWTKKMKTDSKTIEIQDEFTQEKIADEDVKVYQIDDNKKVPVKVEDGKATIDSVSPETKISVESPFYKKREVEVAKSNTENQILLMQPDDYALMLKAFMQSDIKDWQTRKEQLQKILADDLEVIVMLPNNLGAEYYNKKEFSEKLVIPTSTIKKMQILEIKNNSEGKIQFIRIKQE
ncbi:hypothetical protein [Flavobacterium lacus]|uniref:Uncharacterized protein n=1 Tax=Flavobacterium lacus TaxID=1353778 RepID=A0A328WQ30_9FLAO|nr:hypothetical protein [Flavobacterium lacus]RAR48452.1 hypothetical protein B0I10_10560 [Flavobacterium lacus]